MDFSLIIDNIGIYLNGLQNTVVLVSISLLFGLISSTALTVLVIPAIYRLFKT